MRIIKNHFLAKIFRFGYWIVGIWLIIGTCIFIIYPAFIADDAFVDLEYRSRVYEIEYRPGHRGHPHVKFNFGWYLLTIDEMEIVPYMQVGDSIVKEKGSRKIKVYRKDKNGTYFLKEFD